MTVFESHRATSQFYRLNLVPLTVHNYTCRHAGTSNRVFLIHQTIIVDDSSTSQYNVLLNTEFSQTQRPSRPRSKVLSLKVRPSSTHRTFRSHSAAYHCRTAPRHTYVNSRSPATPRTVFVVPTYLPRLESFKARAIETTINRRRQMGRGGGTLGTPEDERRAGCVRGLMLARG